MNTKYPGWETLFVLRVSYIARLKNTKIRLFVIQKTPEFQITIQPSASR
jgi:hypothetical protein